MLAGRVSLELKDDVDLTLRIMSLLASYAELDSIARDFLGTLQYYLHLLQGHPSWQRFDPRLGSDVPCGRGNAVAGAGAGVGVGHQSTCNFLGSVSGNSPYHVASEELLGLVRHPFGDLRVRPESSLSLFRATLINHEECSLGIHHDWVCEYDSDPGLGPIQSEQAIRPWND